MTDTKSDSGNMGAIIGKGVGSVSDPKDFSESGSEHRKGIIGSTSLIVVLVSAVEIKPVLLGVEVSVPIMWVLIGIAHVYFFSMWRITAPIEHDSEKRFWNLKGLFRQALLRDTKGFPGKTKAQIFFIRALPIWAFVIGSIGIVCGIFRYICA